MKKISGLERFMHYAIALMGKVGSLGDNITPFIGLGSGPSTKNQVKGAEEEEHVC